MGRLGFNQWEATGIYQGLQTDPLTRGFGGFGPAAMMSTLHFERTLLNGEPEGL